MKKINLVVFFLMSYITVAQDLTVISGGSITIPQGSYVFVGGNFSNTAGTVTLNSNSNEFSSLLVSGTASGNITYNRYVNIVGTGEWDLIGAPVSDMAFSSLITEANIATNGSFYAVGAYDNTTDTWTNATSATAGNLELGQGYQMATTAIVTTNSHTDASVYVSPKENELVFRSSLWNLDDSVKTNLHNLDGTISISGVTYAVTGLKSAGSLIYYYVTPNPRDNGLTTNGSQSLATTYNTSTGATLNFTGTIANGDQSVTINNNDAANSGAGRRWNLIANPFASYLNGNSTADGTNNFLTVNTAAIDDVFEAIYGWNADGTGYTIYNNTSTATHLAPGQGFFVAAAGSGGDQTITFTKAMQTVTGVDDFVAAKSSVTSYELVLDMHSDAVKVADTKFYFKEGLTLGVDPGYDAGAFNQSSGFSSRLLEQDNGIGMAINAMPIDAMSNVIIPLVIYQQAGVSLKIQIANSTIPEDINVYLEDTIENTFTLLTTESFELLAQTTFGGVGRFFLHVTTSTLSTDTVSSTSLLTAYKGVGNAYISIEGLQQFSKPAELTLYNALGMKILSRNIQNPSQKEMLSTAGIKTGVYILKVQAENIVFTKKLVIE
jgi:hypothetical protein